VKTELSAVLPPVAADPDLMKHALINVIKNAVDAMPEGGTITIATRVVSAAWRVWAVLSVADTGPGVDVATIEQLFQPFYTTKSKGTGLGLPIARRIVESHGGEISVENVPPHGARFSLFVPVR
jgi:signal transduction histidine kinase